MATTKFDHAYNRLNAGHPTDSLETQSIKVLYKSCVFESWWVDHGKKKGKLFIMLQK